MGYYVVKYFLDAYTLKDDNTCHGKNSTSDELVVRAKYIIYMKENINWYWYQK